MNQVSNSYQVPMMQARGVLLAAGVRGDTPSLLGPRLATRYAQAACWVTGPTEPGRLTRGPFSFLVTISCHHNVDDYLLEQRFRREAGGPFGRYAMELDAVNGLVARSPEAIPP